MTERAWQRVTGALGAVLAVLLALTAVVVLLPVGSANPRSTSAAFASQQPSPSASGAATSPKASPKASASAGASPSSPPSTATAAITTILFKEMRLDAGIDPVGRPRTIRFNSDGPGTVTARVGNSSQLSSTRLCVAPAGGSAICHDGSTGTVSRTASAGRGTWTVTLAGVGISTPTVDLTLTFRAVHPSVRLTGFRFDGTSQSGNNGFVARMKLRTKGAVTIDAGWGAKPFGYDLAVADLTNRAVPVERPGTGTQVKTTFQVNAPVSLQLTLANSQDPGVGRIDLGATLAWP